MSSAKTSQSSSKRVRIEQLLLLSQLATKAIPSRGKTDRIVGSPKYFPKTFYQHIISLGTILQHINGRHQHLAYNIVSSIFIYKSEFQTFFPKSFKHYLYMEDSCTVVPSNCRASTGLEDSRYRVACTITRICGSGLLFSSSCKTPHGT